MHVQLGFGLAEDEWLARLRRAETADALGWLGPYELLAELGRGGQGIVYRSRQPQTNRPIALKRLTPGALASAEFRARFVREIKTAAALQHPNIVTVYGCELIDNQPVLLMELVEGQPADRWALGADGRPRPVREVLALFERICHAIRHAHQNGVIHRDLKPSNILVVEEGVKGSRGQGAEGQRGEGSRGQGAEGPSSGARSSADPTLSPSAPRPLGPFSAQPKVLDFGLAKLLAGDDSDLTQVTQTAGFLGTPAYASPEQCTGRPGGVDARSDVYSLGVLLYRMLTGKLPHGSGKGITELLRAIERDDAPRPSSLRAEIGAELDAIVLKALAKEPQRRYQSVDALLEDVQRFLAGAPVLAHPPGVLYQLRKLASRNRAATLLTLGLAGALAALAVSSTLQMWRAERLREAAETARTAAEMGQAREAQLRAAAVAQEERARREAENARAVARFAGGMLSRVNPSYAGELDKKLMLLVLGNAAAEAHAELAGQPEVEAEIRTALADSYASVGENERALEQARLAAALLSGALGEDHPDTLRARSALAVQLSNVDQFEEVECELQELDARCGELLGDDDFETLKLRELRAELLNDRGRHDDAAALFERVASAARAAMSPDEPWLINWSVRQAGCYADLRRFHEAEALLLDALSRLRGTVGEAHPETLGVMNTLTKLYLQTDRIDEAGPLAERTVALRRRVLGDDHQETIAAGLNLVNFHATQGRYAEAEAQLGPLLESSRRVLGPSHTITLMAMNYVAGVRRFRGRYAEAEPMARESAALHRARFGDADPRTIRSVLDLAKLLFAMDRDDEAAVLTAEAYETSRSRLGPQHELSLTATVELGRVRLGEGALPEAESLLRQAQAGWTRLRGKSDFQTLIAQERLAEVLRCRGRLEEAAKLLERSVAIRRAKRGDDHHHTLTALARLGRVYGELGRDGEAEQALLDAATRGFVQPSLDHPDARAMSASYSDFLMERWRWLEAERWLTPVIDAAGRAAGGGDEAAALTVRRGTCQAAMGDVAGAEASFRWAIERLAGGARVSPAWVEARVGLAEVLLERADFEAAGELLHAARPAAERWALDAVEGRRCRGMLVRLYRALDCVEPDGGYAECAAQVEP